MNLAIIDYGAGNTANVKNAFEKLGVRARISKSENAWKRADALVLPGVGAFGSAIKRLGKRTVALKRLVSEGKPFLGICLGMQLLMKNSEESPGARGLDLLPGVVRRFRTGLPVPQIGWNRVKPLNSPLFEGLPEFYAYFANSYYCKIADRTSVAATTSYGLMFASAFLKGNIFATQFHPEKSGRMGLKILQNFIREVKK